MFFQKGRPFVILLALSLCQTHPAFSQPCSIIPFIKNIFVNDPASRIVQLDRDAVSNLVERFEKGDPHLEMLRRLGLPIQPNSKKAVHTTTRAVLENYRSEIQKAVSSGLLQPDDVIRPSVPFRHKKTKEIQLIDPLSEAIPDKKIWEQITGEYELDMKTWAKGLAEGKALFQIGMEDHDLGHLAEYLSDFEKMKAVRNLYRKINDGKMTIAPFGWFEKVNGKWENLRSIGKGKKNNLGIEEKQFAQIFIAEETLSVPNLKAETEIRKLLPELFHSNSNTVNTQRARLRAQLEQDPHRVYQVVDELSANSEKILIRTGGGMRDTYNLYRYGYARGTINWDIILNQSSATTFHATPLGYQETLHARIEQLRLLSTVLKDPVQMKKLSVQFKVTPEQLNHHAKDFMSDELARVEIALSQGIQLKITPAQIVNDIGSPVATSKTHRFFDSYTRKESFTRWAFCK